MRVDLVVIGSVVVSERGFRIGKGEGFADMEWAMMASTGAVGPDTVIVTIVHDEQASNLSQTHKHLRMHTSLPYLHHYMLTNADAFN